MRVAIDVSDHDQHEWYCMIVLFYCQKIIEFLPFLIHFRKKRNKSITLNLGYQGAQAFERQVEGNDLARETAREGERRRGTPAWRPLFPLARPESPSPLLSNVCHAGLRMSRLLFVDSN